MSELASIRRGTLAAAAIALMASFVLTGCAGEPAASEAPDSTASCAKFEAAANNFIDQLGDPVDGAIEGSLTSMNEAAAFASGDVQQKMGDAILSLPPTPADLVAPGAREEAKTANAAFGAVSETCKAAGAELSLHTIPES